MNLILWRHAEAEDTARGGDLARPLTARGRAQAARIAAWLRPDCLPTRACWQARRDAARKPSPRWPPTSARSQRSAREPAPRHCCRPQAEQGADATVLVVVHQPTIGAAAALAMGARGASWHVDKGAVWWLVRGSGGAVRLRAVQSPDDLP